MRLMRQVPGGAGDGAGAEVTEDRPDRVGRAGRPLMHPARLPTHVRALGTQQRRAEELVATAESGSRVERGDTRR